MGLFERFSKGVLERATSIKGEDQSEVKGSPKKAKDEMIVLGALLAKVALADENFSKEEEEESIREILSCECHLNEDEVSLALSSSRESLESSLDIHTFTREVNAKKSYDERLRVLERLFQVALSDRSLHPMELETLRKISGLLWISHKDFIGLKLRLKKENLGK